MQELTTLVDRCRRGDDLAWEALVRRFQGRVYSLAFHYLRDAEEARDAAQEVFVKIYRKLDGFTGDGFVPWILQLARNHCVDRIRRRRVRPPATDIDIERGPALPDPRPDPEARSLATSRRRLVWRALEAMTDSNREMILLKEIQGLGVGEIAELLRVPVGTVKSRSSRARIELARRVLALDPSIGR